MHIVLAAVYQANLYIHLGQVKVTRLLVDTIRPTLHRLKQADTQWINRRDGTYTLRGMFSPHPPWGYPIGVGRMQ